MAHDPDLDLDHLTRGFDAWLAATASYGPGARVTKLVRPTAGLSSTTFLADLVDTDERTDDLTHADAPGGTRRIVLRLPPEQAVHRGDTLGIQVAVQDLLAAHGIPAPAPAHHETDPSWLGSPFVTMPCVPGHVGGEAAGLDPWIMASTAGQQATLYATFTDAVAALHRLDWTGSGLEGRVRGAGQTVADDLTYWADYLDWATDHRAPARLTEAFGWLRDHRPTSEPPRSLLWGDTRLGNAIFDPARRLRAVIDWETAWIGPAEADVGYWLVLETLVDDLLGVRPEGFPDRDQTVASYQALAGRPLLALDWFEIFGAVTAACITVRLSVLAHGRPPAPSHLDRNPVVGLIEQRIAAYPT